MPVTPEFDKIDAALAKVRGTRIARAENELLRPEARELFSSLMDEALGTGGDELTDDDRLVLATIAAAAGWHHHRMLERARTIEKDLGRVRQGSEAVVAEWRTVLKRNGMHLQRGGRRLVLADEDHVAAEPTRDEIEVMLKTALEDLCAGGRLALIESRLHDVEEMLK